MDTMTLDEYHALKQKPTKYGNTKVVADGHTFDSKAEHRRYCELKLLERDGVITHLKPHPTFVLLEPFKDNEGHVVRAIKYTADFEYFERGHHIVEDVKGGKATQTEAFRMRVKLLKKRYPEIKFKVVT